MLLGLIWVADRLFIVGVTINNPFLYENDR